MQRTRYAVLPHGLTLVILVALLGISSQISRADDISLFVVTGQSNARERYASSIGVALRASGHWDHVRVYNSQRSGNWLNSWVSGNTGTFAYASNFTEDLWNTDGTSELQNLIRSLEDEGHTVQVEGFFWFQGEGDTGSPGARNIYAEKLVWMIQELQSHYGQFNSLFTLIDWNPDRLADLHAINRTPEDVEEIRAALLEAAQQLGAAVHDSRDYPRTDLWHVSSNDDWRGLYGPAMDLGADEASTFINQFQCSADLNNDGKLNFFDISAFIKAFQAGCP